MDPQRSGQPWAPQYAAPLFMASTSRQTATAQASAAVGILCRVLFVYLMLNSEVGEGRPQEAQYIPGPWLNQGKNELIFLEVEKSPAEATGLSPRPAKT